MMAIIPLPAGRPLRSFLMLCPDGSFHFTRDVYRHMATKSELFPDPGDDPTGKAGYAPGRYVLPAYCNKIRTLVFIRPWTKGYYCNKIRTYGLSTLPAICLSFLRKENEL